MKKTETITVRENVLKDALRDTAQREQFSVGEAIYHGIVKEALTRMLEKGPDKIATSPAEAPAKSKSETAHKKIIERAYARKEPAVKAIRKAGGKTARILAILADGKDHAAVKIGKALGMSSGHVAQHLAGRVAKGLVRRVLPGVFQMAWPKGKKKA